MTIGSLSTGFTTQRAATLAVGFANVDASYAGVIRYATTTSHLAKVGTAAYNTQSPAWARRHPSSATSRCAAAATGSFGQRHLRLTSGSPTGAISLAIYAGGEFRAVTGTSVGGRIQNNAAISMSGGLLHYNAPLFNTTSGYSDIVGSLALNSGRNTVRITNPTTEKRHRSDLPARLR